MYKPMVSQCDILTYIYIYITVYWGYNVIYYEYFFWDTMYKPMVSQCDILMYIYINNGILGIQCIILCFFLGIHCISQW